MTRDLLNWSQRNAIGVTLCAVEITLREALAELATEEQGILYRRNGILSPQEREQVSQLIHAALGEIAVMAKELNLPVEVQSARSKLWGKLAIDWADLQDILPEKLIAYGPVVPELKPVLSSPLQRLIELVDHLHHAVAGDIPKH